MFINDDENGFEVRKIHLVQKQEPVFNMAKKDKRSL